MYVRRCLVSGFVYALAVGTSAAPAFSATPQPVSANGGQYCVESIDPELVAEPKCFVTYREAISNATGGRYADAPELTEMNKDPKLRAMHVDKVNTANKEAVRENSTLRQGTSPPDSGALPKEPYREATQIPIGNILLMEEFLDVNWSGGANVFYGSRECSGTTTDVDFYSATPLAATFNNSISSYANYGQCWTKHFSGGTYDGFTMRCTSSGGDPGNQFCNDNPAMSSAYQDNTYNFNDRTSSLQLS